jgi:hypothetical protein
MSSLLEQLNLKGFIFIKYDPKIINFNDLHSTAKALMKVINSLISIEGETLHYDIDTIKYNQQIKPHYHIIPGSFQVVAWVPNDKFTGREFLFGTGELLQKVTPQIGYFCIMKPNDPQFLHGVTKLTSNNDIQSIGFSSLVKKVEGNNDIFSKYKRISKNELDIETLIY